MTRATFRRSNLARCFWAGVLVWTATLHPASAAGLEITAVTPRDVAYVLDWDQANPPRDYHLIKGSVAATRTGAAGAATLRVLLSLVDESDTPVSLVSGSETTASWSAPALAEGATTTHTFDFAIDPNVRLETDRRYRVRARMQEWIQLGGVWRWLSVLSSPSVDSAERTYYHFTNTAGTDAAWNTLARIESVSFFRDWRVQTATSTAYQQFRIATSTRFLRFDEMGSSSSYQQALDFQFRMTLVDDLGASQTLTVPTADGHLRSETLATWQAGKVPADTLETLYYYLKPSSQLDPVNRLYTLTVEVWAAPASGQAPVMLSRRATAPTRLLDFNGTLRFGSTFTTTMQTAIRTATPVVVNPTYVAAEMDLSDVSKAGGDTSYSGNLGTRTLRLYATGIATYNDAASLTLTNEAGATVWSKQSLAGIAYKLSPTIALTSSGATTDLRINPLPAGMGIGPNAPTGTEPWTASLSSELPVKTGITLDAAMAPSSSVVWSYPSGVWVMEESKPVAIRATAITWVPGAGKLNLSADGTVHHPETALRATLAAAPTDIPAAYRERRSNSDAWLLANAVDTSPEPFIRGNTPLSPDAGSNAVATMDFSLGAGSFASHFPEATISTTAASGNRIYVLDDMISSGTSFLDNVSIQLSYLRTDPEATSPAPSYHTTTLTPTGATARLGFTPTGGLRAACTTGAGGHALRWGRLNDGRYAFSTDPFLSAVFFMPGTFYPQGFLATGDNDLFHQQCPVTLHLSGQVPNKWKFADLERPGNDPYKTNSLLADYAGVNLRVQNEAAGFQGRSIICGTEAPAYPLTAQSRYYARKSGVTGIHDANGGPSGVSLFGFDATLTSYGLSFRDSVVRHSVTEGDLDVPYPSDFTLPITGLSFTASGTPNGGAPAAIAPLTLSYWQAEVVAMGLEFIGTSETDLTAGALAIESSVSLPSLGQGVVAYGKLGFKPNGRLIRQTDNIGGITSRLRPPNQISFNGPAKPDGYERYLLTPVSDIYLNHYEGTGNPGDGFLNIAGTLDVAFFRDIQVHVQASANPNAQAEVAILNLTGGWTTGSGPTQASFFTDSSFDPDNLGRPAGVPLNDYRSGAAYRPHAKRSWMDAVDFDYPLVWDNVTRMFHTPEDFNGEVDLLVIDARHQLESLSAEQAALNFGASYDGIPQISVGDLLVNAVDEATGALSAIEKALAGGVQQAAGAALWGASDAVARLLNDNLDELTGPVIEEQLGGGIQAAVIDPLADPDGSLKAEALWDLSPLTNPNNWVCTELVKLGSMPDDANRTISGEAQAAIDKMIEGLDVFIGEDGLLETDGNGNYVYGAELVFSLIDEIASDEIKGYLGITPGNPCEQYIAQQTTALVNKYVPALNAIRARLVQIRARLVEIRNLFNPNQMFAKVITERFNALTDDWYDSNPAVQTLGKLLAEDLKEHLRTRYGGSPEAFAVEANRAETSRFLVRRIRDRLAAGAIASHLQTLFRQQLQDLQQIIDQSVGSVFANFKHIIRDLVAEVTGSLDNTISNFTDELNGLVGAAGVQGSAVIRGDTLSHLRLDATLSLTLDEPVEFKGYIEINQLQANSGYGDAREIRIGGDDVPIEIMDSTAKFDVEARVVLDAGDNSILGLGGKFEMVEGRLAFEGFAITQMGAAVMFGSGENYLAAKLGMEFESFSIAGGLFVGHAESLEPLILVDPDVAAVISSSSITGIYVYGEAYMPIVDLGCFFKVSAGLGLGAFYFTENTTYGGKIKAKVDGEALCVVSVSGEVVLVGAKSDIMRFAGRGKISGKVGWCPFCVKFSKQIEFTYDENNGFDANF